VRATHALHACFPLQVLCEAFAFVSGPVADDAPPAKAFRKVLDAVEECEGALQLTPGQARQAAVWRLAVIMPQQLATDDSFMFSKAAQNVRELVEGLPEVLPGEDAALACLQVLCCVSASTVLAGPLAPLACVSCWSVLQQAFTSPPLVEHACQALMQAIAEHACPQSACTIPVDGTT
jgi:hypothetical protein